METIDDDVARRAVDFIKRQNAAGKPVFDLVRIAAEIESDRAGDSPEGSASGSPVVTVS